MPKGQLYQLLLLPKQSGVPAVPVSNGKIEIKENRAAYLIKINTNREKKKDESRKEIKSKLFFFIFLFLNKNIRSEEHRSNKRILFSKNKKKKWVGWGKMSVKYIYHYQSSTVLIRS